MARPRKKIDREQIIKLAAINCSYEEMATILKCNESTLTRRFAQAIKEGRTHGRMSLKRKQYEMAINGNVGMLVWLGKNMLGQSDKNEISIQRVTDEQFAEEAKRRMELDAPRTESNTTEVPRIETEVQCEIQPRGLPI